MEAPTLATHFISVHGNRWYEEVSPNPAVCSCYTDGFLLFPTVTILPTPRDVFISVQILHLMMLKMSKM